MRLRLWHLFGLIAAAAVFLGVMNYRHGVDDPAYVWSRQLRSVDSAKRLAALSELTKLGPNARSATSSLLEALSDVDPRVRRGSAQTLLIMFRSYSGITINDPLVDDAKSALAAALHDPDINVRRMVAIAIAPLGVNPRVGISALIDAIEDTDPNVRGTAVDWLSIFAAKGDEDAFRAVHKMIKDLDPSVRGHVIRSLAWPSMPISLIPESVAALLPAMNDKDALVRAIGVETLGRLAEMTSINVDPLIRAISDLDPYVRRQAIEFAPIGIQPQAVFPAVIRALSDPDAQVRRVACVRLRAPYHGDPEELLLALRYATQDEHRDVQSAAHESILWIEEQTRKFKGTILPTFIRNLDDTNPGIRSSAAETLGHYGPKAKELVPALIRSLDDPEPAVRIESARALRLIGPPARPALPALDRISKDTNTPVAEAAKAAAATLRATVTP